MLNSLWANGMASVFGRPYNLTPLERKQLGERAKMGKSTPPKPKRKKARIEEFDFKLGYVPGERIKYERIPLGTAGGVQFFGHTPDGFQATFEHTPNGDFVQLPPSLTREQIEKLMELSRGNVTPKPKEKKDGRTAAEKWADEWADKLASETK